CRRNGGNPDRLSRPGSSLTLPPFSARSAASPSSVPPTARAPDIGARTRRSYRQSKTTVVSRTREAGRFDLAFVKDPPGTRHATRPRRGSTYSTCEGTSPYTPFLGAP